MAPLETIPEHAVLVTHTALPALQDNTLYVYIPPSHRPHPSNRQQEPKRYALYLRYDDSFIMQYAVTYSERHQFWMTDHKLLHSMPRGHSARLAKLASFEIEDRVRVHDVICGEDLKLNKRRGMSRRAYIQRAWGRLKDLGLLRMDVERLVAEIEGG